VNSDKVESKFIDKNAAKIVETAEDFETEF